MTSRRRRTTTKTTMNRIYVARTMGRTITKRTRTVMSMMKKDVTDMTTNIDATVTATTETWDVMNRTSKFRELWKNTALGRQARKNN